MVEFRSRYQQQRLALRPDASGQTRYVDFQNGVFYTDNEEIVALLREVVAMEARGGCSISEASNQDTGPRLTGSLSYTFNGFSTETFQVHGETLGQVFDRLRVLLTQQYNNRSAKELTPA